MGTLYKIEPALEHSLYCATLDDYIHFIVQCSQAGNRQSSSLLPQLLSPLEEMIHMNIHHESLL